MIDVLIGLSVNNAKNKQTTTKNKTKQTTKQQLETIIQTRHFRSFSSYCDYFYPDSRPGIIVCIIPCQLDKMHFNHMKYV